MARASYATIDLAAIHHNYQQVKRIAPNSQVAAIVKANAYGHGAIEVAKSLEPVADAFAVTCIEEAVELRDAGVVSPILLLEGFFDIDELALISSLDLWCVLHNQEQVRALLNTPMSKPVNVWLKLDTGMHRLGLNAQDYRAAWQALDQCSHVGSIVKMTHFASADDLSSPATAAQLLSFESTTAGLPGESSLANSAAVIAYPATQADWVRPGIMLYGVNPAPGVSVDLKPTMTLTARIIAERVVKAGDTVGYSGTWQAKEPTKVGTVAIGYADGYPRHAKPGTPVFVNGQRSQLLGRVSMDMIAIDLSMFDESCLGLDVELWGANISIDEIAECCNTIPYTLYCGVNARLYKRYIKGNAYR